jgi:hypothetical protein
MYVPNLCCSLTNHNTHTVYNVQTVLKYLESAFFYLEGTKGRHYNDMDFGGNSVWRYNYTRHSQSSLLKLFSDFSHLILGIRWCGNRRASHLLHLTYGFIYCLAGGVQFTAGKIILL